MGKYGVVASYIENEVKPSLLHPSKESSRICYITIFYYYCVTLFRIYLCFTIYIFSTNQKRRSRFLFKTYFILLISLFYIIISFNLFVKFVNNERPVRIKTCCGALAVKCTSLPRHKSRMMTHHFKQRQWLHGKITSFSF